MIPFTYSIYCIPTNQYYYGARWSKTCNPSQLWTTYFTSSKYVKNLILLYGKDAFIPKVRRTFTDPRECRRWEEKFLRRLDAKNLPQWINQHNGGVDFKCLSGEDSPTKRPEVRLKMSKAATGRRNHPEQNLKIGNFWRNKPKSPEQNLKNSRSNMGKKRHSDEQKAKWSHERKGMYSKGDNPRAKSVIVDGMTFTTITDAAEYYGLSRATFRKRYLHAA